MKIEKINENKIRITLNLEDLKEKNIDFHSFMANPIESQSLFVYMLETAEKEIGFITKNYQLSIDALATSAGDFIVTVTRSSENLPNTLKRKIPVKRKSINFEKSIIYAFLTFDDVIAFCKFSQKKFLHKKVYSNKNTSLYKYQDNYYMCFKNVSGNLEELKSFCSSVAEFGTYVDCADLFERKLVEYGTEIIDKNVISIVNKKFK